MKILGELHVAKFSKHKPFRKVAELWKFLQIIMKNLKVTERSNFLDDVFIDTGENKLSKVENLISNILAMLTS